MLMLGKSPAPIIGKLSQLLLLSGGPRSPLDMKAQQSSPRGLKAYDLDGGVGLKIVVALDNQDLPKQRTLCVPYLNRSEPIPHGSLEEDYTYVTCHVPNKTFTKVYYDAHGGCHDAALLIRNSRTPGPSDFLSSCHLCTKKLDGKDIYMYRGEKGFCSPECRSRQMMMDERKEICRSEAVVEEEHIFSTGILAL
ncbi:hypothetical protein PIB30_011552 [Stylosanthes scabra]|uniref:FLZ-type domain-containing protein n=1 Tax=Stylosanthes scabra TaxID=79078 RepID=A0ABU6U4L4_9FABA|nr:hypothetical protein [Stylosanthes scabra]